MFSLLLEIGNLHYRAGSRREKENMISQKNVVVSTIQKQAAKTLTNLAVPT